MRDTPSPITPAAAATTPPVMERACSVRRTVEIVLDPWTFLILREAFFGVRRFDRFQARLGIPRQTLSQRLSALDGHGILVTGTRTGERGRQYFLTDRGKDLFPTMLSLMEFGDRWLAGGAPPPLQLGHLSCGNDCHPVTACSACAGAVDARDVAFRDGPGAGFAPAEPRIRSRRSANPALFERVRPCSVARSLAIIGDRWSFLVLREGWFGVRRFDELREKLGIAPNILADRLSRLVDAGVFRRAPYGAGERSEYRFTPMGRDLYRPMIVMMAWGDRWLAEGRAPLRLRHRTCGGDFTPQVLCSACHQPLRAQDTRYRLRYPFTL